MNAPRKLNGIGRSLIPIDWKEVDKLLEAGCTGVQIGAYFGCHEDTFYQRCMDIKKMSFSAYCAAKRQRGNCFLNAKQYELALRGNIQMLIWLGKQRLEQKEPDKVSSETLRTTFAEMKNAIQDGTLLNLLKQTDEKTPT